MAVQWTKTVSLDKDVYDAANDYVRRLRTFTNFSRFVNHLLRVQLIAAGYNLESPEVEGMVEEYPLHKMVDTMPTQMQIAMSKTKLTESDKEEFEKSKQ